MENKNVVRLNISGFPKDLKDFIIRWTKNTVPNVSMSELFIKLAQDWKEDIPGFERRHRIQRMGGESAVDDEEAERRAKMAELRRQLAELEGR